jgi:hypothetical protein
MKAAPKTWLLRAVGVALLALGLWGVTAALPLARAQNEPGPGPAASERGERAGPGPRWRPPPRLPDQAELRLMERLLQMEPQKLRRLIVFLEQVEQMSPEEKERLLERIRTAKSNLNKIDPADRRLLMTYMMSLSEEERLARFREIAGLTPEERLEYMRALVGEIRASGETVESLANQARERLRERGDDLPTLRERLRNARERGILPPLERSNAPPGEEAGE